MHDKKDADPKAHEEESHSDPNRDRDGEPAGVTVVDPPPTRGGDDPPVGSVR